MAHSEVVCSLKTFIYNLRFLKKSKGVQTMPDKSFANDAQFLETVLDSAVPLNGAATATHEMTSTDDWKSHQQIVSMGSKNIYSITDNENETALSGDGYEVTNGNIKLNEELNTPQASSQKANMHGKKLKVVKHNAPGLVLSPGTSPKTDDLIREDAKGKRVNILHGTVDAPNIYKDISDQYLFTDGGPNQNDIRQADVGDCYFWATALQIVAHDPAQITSMMKLNGSTVETTLYYKRGENWVKTNISRPLGIGGLNRQYKENNYDNVECGVRLDTDAPIKSAWNAVIQNNACNINRTDYCKAALWANCLEQAYSDFTREHGEYGQGPEKAPHSGDEEFEGGTPDSCLHIFYGDKASDAQTSDIENTSDVRNEILKSLIQFKKTLIGKGQYAALGARRIDGDPNNPDDAHAYSIENVSFVDKNGKIIDFTDNTHIAGFISDFIERNAIDISKSKLLLRNPWNNPNVVEGKFFEITLEDFLTNNEWTHLFKAEIAERTSA